MAVVGVDEEMMEDVMAENDSSADEPVDRDDFGPPVFFAYPPSSMGKEDDGHAVIRDGRYERVTGPDIPADAFPARFIAVEKHDSHEPKSSWWPLTGDSRRGR